MCTCRGCYLLFTAEDAELRYRAVPDRYLSFPDFTVDARQYDELEIPVGLVFLFRNSVLGRVVAFYPDPAGATESELPLAAWSRIVAANPQLDLLRPDVEALLIRAGQRGGEFSCQSCRSTPATSWSAGSACCGAASTAAARCGRPWTSSSPRSPTRPLRLRRRRSTDDPLAFTVLDIVAEPYAAAPQLTARLRIEEIDRRRRSTPSRCAARCGSSRSAAVQRCRRGRAARPVRRSQPVARHPPAVPLDALRRRWCRASPGTTEVDLPMPCTYDFEVAGSKYLHALRDGFVPLLLLFSGTVFTRGSRGSAVEQVGWDCEASTSSRSRSGSR